MIKIYSKNGFVYFAQFDREAGIYEIFLDSSGETYIGCADTIKEAKAVAKDHSEQC